MFILVLFTDQVFAICEPKDVSAFSNKCPAVKYKDGRKYTARILAIHKDIELLQAIQSSLEEETPVPFKTIKDTKKKLSYRELLKHENASQGGNNLYLDPYVLPVQNKDDKYYTFSLSGHEETRVFFQSQSSFMDFDIMRQFSEDEGSVKKDSKDEVLDSERETNVKEDTSCKEVLKPQVFKDNSRSETDVKIHTSSESTPKNSEHQITEEAKTSGLITKPLILDEEDRSDFVPSDENGNLYQLGKISVNTDEISIDEPGSEEKTLTVTKNVFENFDVAGKSDFPPPDENGNSLFKNQFNLTARIYETLLDGSADNSKSPEKSSVNAHTHKISIEEASSDEKTFTVMKNVFENNREGRNIANNALLGPQEKDILQALGGLNDQGSLGAAGNGPPNLDSIYDFDNLELSTNWEDFLDDPAEFDTSISKPTIAADVILDKNLNVLFETPSTSQTSLESPPLINTEYFGASTPNSEIAPPEEELVSESCDESDGDEYVPSKAELSDSEMSSEGADVPETSRNEKRIQTKNDSALNISLGNSRPGMSAPDDTELTVTTSKKTTKKQFCLYCHVFQTKLARHLRDKHKDQEDVQKFMCLPPKNLERKKMIEVIRKAGNNLFNSNRELNNGELLVVRRPQERMKKSAQDFVACGNCKGQYSKSTVRHHFRKCTKKGSSNERLVMVKGRKVSGRVHEIASEATRKYLWPYMREDSVVLGIRYDMLINLFANKQCEKYGSRDHLFQMVRARLRLLGRFVKAVKEHNPFIRDFADVFQPRNYDSAIAAVRTVAGFNVTTRTFDHPAVASNLGGLLKYCGAVIRSEYIRLERTQDKKRANDFLKLHSEDYSTSVNRAVMETQLQNNRRKKIILPNTDDIVKLHNFLKFEREKHYELLKTGFSRNLWRKLAEITLVSLQLFNRRRAGEIERVLLDDFNSYQSIDEVSDKEAYQALSKEGQLLAKKYVRFMIRGKKSRGVPVLIPSELLGCILLIKDNRSNAQVPEDNEYLFGLPSRDPDQKKHLRACPLLKKFAENCGADVPETLRGTQLRKHVATKCISLNLSENQVSDLANFMGHANKIHTTIYRQPVIQNDILKISQLLEIAQGTNSEGGIVEESSSGEEEHNGTLSEDEDNVEDVSMRAGPSDLNKSRKSITIRPAATHRRWTENECAVVLGAFEGTIKSGKMPTGEEIKKLISDNACLKGREVAQLRTWLHGKKKKNQSE